MHPPKPGLQNVLCAYSKLSYLSAVEHTVFSGHTRPPVLVHAACGDVLATADTHVTVYCGERSVTIPHRLHFKPLDIVIHCRDYVTIVVAGADGAWFTRLSGVLEPVPEKLSPLPGSAGYAIVALAINHEYIAAASMDGRVAIWQTLNKPANLIFDIQPLSGDRITDMKFVQDGLLIAWWSGRLVFHELRFGDSVVWTMDAVRVSKHVFGAFSGSFLVVRDDVVAMATGRGDLVFVRIFDGAYCKSSVGSFVKGLCDYEGRLHLVVDAKLVKRDWMSKEELDKLGVLTSVLPRKTKTEGEEVCDVDTQG